MALMIFCRSARFVARDFIFSPNLWYNDAVRLDVSAHVDRRTLVTPPGTTAGQMHAYIELLTGAMRFSKSVYIDLVRQFHKSDDITESGKRHWREDSSDTRITRKGTPDA
jgi:hypothetical protein